MLRESEVPKFGGGPLGLGDPDDRRLRKVERDLVITKMMKEEAQKKCDSTLKLLLSCMKDAGFKISAKCQAEKEKNNDCLLKWLKNPQFAEEITNTYLDARSHYRRTGEPIIKYEIKKRSGSGFC